MTDPDTRLRDLLQAAAPDGPDAPDVSPAERSAAVVRRARAARRRDRGLVAGAAVAVLAVAVALPLSLRGDEEPNSAAPPPAVTAAPCPTAPVDVSTPTPDADLAGVVSVRLCPAAPEAPVDAATVDPTQPLLGEAAAAFAEDAAALPSTGLPDACAAMTIAFDPWALVAETDDGETVTVGTTTRACSAVSVGGAERGSAEVLAAFVGNLDRQRDGDLTPGLDALACPEKGRLAQGADTWNASFDVASATAGVICYVADPMGGVEYARTVGKIHPSVLEPIRDDLAGHLVPRAAAAICADTGPQRLLLLADDAGDVAAFVDDRCSGGFSSALGSWQPSAAAEAAIAEALGGRARG
jgi:hypothetical protein